MVREYWSKPPADQGNIRDQVEQETARAEEERKRIVGYFTTIEAPDSSMQPREPDKNIIVCAECYGDPRYRPDGDRWETVIKEEYTDKEFILYKAKCSECGKTLV